MSELKTKSELAGASEIVTARCIIICARCGQRTSFDQAAMIWKNPSAVIINATTPDQIRDNGYNIHENIIICKRCKGE